MFKCQDDNPFCFHDFGMFYMLFLSAHNFFPNLYHDFGFCVTMLYIYKLTWCGIVDQLSWRGQFQGFYSPSIALNSFRLWISMTFLLCVYRYCVGSWIVNCMNVLLFSYWICNVLCNIYQTSPSIFNLLIVKKFLKRQM